MYRIRRLLVWFRRFRYSRGFGLQSPFAYGVVRYVVNEHYPYYAYERLKKEMPSVGKKVHKMGRLYFRITNWKQPKVALNIGDDAKAFETYVTAACRATRVVNVKASHSVTPIDDKLLRESEEVSLIRVVPVGDYKKYCERILECAHEKSVLVVERIHKNSATLCCWKELCSHERVTVSFDLYYCGIILFEKKHYKQNYKINF